MGAWGDQPKDNDSSHDMFFDVSRAAASQVAKFFKVKRIDSYGRWDRVGVVQLVIEQMPGALEHMQDTLKAARNDLDDILEDDEFLAAWKSPASTKKHAQGLLRKIETILQKM